MEKTPPILKRPYPVTGMSCASCALNVEKVLQKQPGVAQASVNYANGNAFVEYDPTVTDEQALRKAVRGIGYDLLVPVPEAGSTQPVDPEYVQRRASKALTRRMIWAMALSLPQVLISMGLIHLPKESFALWALATPVVLIFGWPFFRHGVQMALHRTAGMDTLVALSTGSAYLWSVFNTISPDFLVSKGLTPDTYFEAASVVIAFILMGKWLEDRAKSSASEAIRKLMGLRPETVMLELRNGSTQEVSIKEVVVGNRILVRPGERVAVDGVIVHGESYVDESMLTGEPIAIPKVEGNHVFAGTLNQKGSFRMEADRIGADTLLEGIIRRVREAQGSKAPVQRMVDRVAAVFVPSVLGIALLSFGLWWALGGTAELPHAFLAFVTVLVIACPCALGLATPTALIVGIGKAASAGIFIKDAASLERLNGVNALVLDKTGTLTEGKPKVEEIRWVGAFGGSPRDSLGAAGANAGAAASALETNTAAPQILAVLYSLEKASGHPLGEAIGASLESTHDLPLLPLQQVRSMTGLGMEGHFGRSIYRVGHLRWFRSLNINVPAAEEAWAEEIEKSARTVVFFAKDSDVLAGISLFDQLRPGAAQAVQTLKNRGIAVHLLTGDNLATAEAIAREAGISSYRSGVLPEEKGAFIKSLQDQGMIVGMAGDGINDAEALARADVGIAMGGGTDIAMDIAGMTLVNGRLEKIPEAMDLSKATFTAVRQNLGFAFVYNVIGIPLAAGAFYPSFGILLNPMIAGAAMALSSLTVVGNSLRLKNWP